MAVSPPRTSPCANGAPPPGLTWSCRRRRCTRGNRGVSFPSMVSGLWGRRKGLAAPRWLPAPLRSRAQRWWGGSRRGALWGPEAGIPPWARNGRRAGGTAENALVGWQVRNSP